jgi:hypothetical protein
MLSWVHQEGRKYLWLSCGPSKGIFIYDVKAGDIESGY